MRHRHLMRRTTSDRQPSQVASVSVDTKADVVPGESRRWQEVMTKWSCVGCSGAKGVYGPDVFRSGPDAASFWDAVSGRLAKGGSLWLFAPQASRLCALMKLWEKIDDGTMFVDGRDCRVVQAGAGKGRSRNAGYAVLEDPPFVLDLRVRGLPGLLRVIDSANYGVDFSEVTGGADERCKSLHSFVRGMIGILTSEGLGALQATVGSQSFYSFRRKHLNTLVDCHDNEIALRLERSGYYGGRCEAFRLGRLPGRVYHLDVSSMYPSLYATLPLPVGLLGVAPTMDAGVLADLPPDSLRIADVTIETGEPCYPWRDERNNITVWPVGRFRTTLAGAELAHCVASGRVTEWHSLSWYAVRPFLQSCSAHLHNLRVANAADNHISRWLKSLGVCIVGKLGQQERRWEDAKTNHLTPLWGAWEERDANGQWERWRSFAGITQREHRGGFAFDSVPAAAACVTAAGRMQLLAYIRCCGWNHVHYVDTDALMVDSVGYKRLRTMGHIGIGEWGKLKVEGVYGDVRIYGIKDYVADGKTVCAGLSVRNRSAGSEACVGTQRIGVVGAMHGGRQPDTLLHHKTFTKSNIYRHGRVAVGGTVGPFWLGREWWNGP